jgi:HD-GYP domain-containing protein (c-di-GMP phosphodiesterase class II)
MASDKSGPFDHADCFAALNEQASLQDKLDAIRSTMAARHPFIERVAVALYDAASDEVKTFLYSSDSESPLTHYQARLGDTPSLQETARRCRPRIVNDLELFADGRQRHTRALAESGYRASYTLPMMWEGVLFGFVFINAREPGVFTDAVLVELDMVAHLITLMIYNERSSIRTLSATVKSALQMTHERDPETGSHLERMARYAQLIARGLEDQYGFDDQFVEHIFLFSPLHDLGKISVPDRILLKPGRLTGQEFESMKVHAVRGRQIVDSLLRNYGLDGIGYVDMLRNIAQYHHEAVDGTGYPRGLRAEHIPIEARIVAVADVFDALTSRRPYKEPWSNERAFAKLREMAGEKLDWDCVRVLIEQREEVEKIQARYRENEFG